MMERIVELEELAKRYGEVQDQIEIFEQLKDNLRQGIILTFEKSFGHESYCYEAQSGKLGRVIEHPLEYEVLGLKNSLSSIQWNLIKKEAVDIKKLHGMIDTGQIKIDGSVLKKGEVDKVSFKPAK